MSGKPMVQSYGHGMESKASIQSITGRKIIVQPIRMLGHGTVTTQHRHGMNCSITTSTHTLYERDSMIMVIVCTIAVLVVAMVVIL